MDPNFDAYAVPGSAPQTFLPEDPTFFSGEPVFSEDMYTSVIKFYEGVKLDYLWMPGGGNQEFGVNDVELSTQFNFPFFGSKQPLEVTPGFAIHYWSGPKIPPADLPPYVFDAYLDAAWNPQPTPIVGAELAFRVGVYSDFEKITSDSIRVTGKGIVVFNLSRSFTLKAGMEYLDRNRVKILPAGGVTWKLNNDLILDIYFPRPSIRRHMVRTAMADWWLYLRGEYGGGAWTVRRVGGPLNGLLDEVDYNDLRIALGVDFKGDRLKGLFEVGYAFEREIRYASGTDPEAFRPDTSVFVRGVLVY